MVRSFSAICLGFALLVAAAVAPVCAADVNQQETLTKSAIAMVLLPGGEGTASALCVDKRGIFVTSHRAVKDAPQLATVRVIVDPNGKPNAYDAVVQCIDTETGLAVLQIEGKEQEFPFVPLGDDTALREDTPVRAYGFPYTQQSRGLTTFPALRSDDYHIVELQRKDGALKRLQVNDILHPGYAGGPVCNKSGEVVAIVQTGATLGDLFYVVPVSRVTALLDKPAIKFIPTVIAAAKQHEEVELRIGVTSFRPLAEPLTVDVEVKTDGIPLRRFTATPDGPGPYRVKFVPMPTGEMGLQLQATVTVDGKVERGTVGDKTFRIGDRERKLAEVQSIEWGDVAKVAFIDESTATGQLSGLSELVLQTRAGRHRLDMTRMRKLVLLPQPATKIDYALIVRQQGKELARQEGRIDIGDSALDGVRFVPYQGAAKMIALPDLIDDAVWGGGGRFLLLSLKNLHKIAVYDVNRAKIVTFLSPTHRNLKIAAGMTKFFAIAPNDNLVECWSLIDFKKEFSRPLPFQEKVALISMGYASDGPLLIVGTPPTGGWFNYLFYDPVTFSQMTIDGTQAFHHSDGSRLHMRAAGYGNVFTMWQTGVSPQGMEAMILIGKRVQREHEHESAGLLVPNLDGTSILTGSAGICSLQMRPRIPWRGVTLVPTTHAQLSVSLPGSEDDEGRKSRPGVFHIQTYARLADLPDLELGGGGKASRENDLTIEKRILFVPQARQLVTIPFSNDRLLVKPFDLAAAMKASGGDWFYVLSMPPRVYRPGQEFKYRLEVVSRDQPLKFELTEGPAGMSVDEAGVITWSVPNDFHADSVACNVKITNAISRRIMAPFSVVRYGW